MMKRKVLSALLAFAMLLSMVVMPVGATETELVNITPISIGLYTDNTTTGENRVAKSLLYADYSSGASADMMIDGVFGLGTQGTVMGVENIHTYFLMDLGEERTIHDIYVYGVPGFSIYFTGYFEFRGTNNPDATFAEMDLLGTFWTDSVANDSNATTPDAKLSDYKTATGETSYQYVAIGRTGNAGGVCNQWALSEIEIKTEASVVVSKCTPASIGLYTDNTSTGENRVAKSLLYADYSSGASANMMVDGVFGLGTQGTVMGVENIHTYFLMDLGEERTIRDIYVYGVPGFNIYFTGYFEFRGTNNPDAAFAEMDLLGTFWTDSVANDSNATTPDAKLSDYKTATGETSYQYVAIGRTGNAGGVCTQWALTEIEVYAEGTGSDQPITPPGPSEPTIPETLVSRNKPLEVFRNDTLVPEPDGGVGLIFNGLKSDIGYVTCGSGNTGSYYVRVDLMNKMPVTDVGLIVRPSSWGGILEASNKIQIRGTNDSSARFEDMTLLTETNFTSQPDNNIDFNWSLSRNEGYNEDLEFRYICIGRPNLDYGGTIILVEAEIYGRPEVDFSGWKKSADGDANTVSVDIKNNTDDTQSYLLVAMGYDEDDKPSDVEVTSVDVTSGSTETAST